MKRKFRFFPNRRHHRGPTQQQYWRAYLRHHGIGAHGLFTFGPRLYLWPRILLGVPSVKGALWSWVRSLKYRQLTPREACHAYWIEKSREWL